MLIAQSVIFLAFALVLPHYAVATTALRGFQQFTQFIDD